MAVTYAAFTKQDSAEILDSIYQSISCTLTDRAAVNHCVTDQLSLRLQTTLIELKCNVHPVDGLASATRKALKDLDRQANITSGVMGNDCRAANFIYAVSKLRYKAGKGDPSGFKTFLRDAGLSEGVIPRYVGNRLHVLFLSAGVIYEYRDLLTKYLKKYCVATKLRLALIGDFANNVLMTHIRVLGLFGKVLTGPWMTLFYKNAENRRHLEMIPYMHKCLGHLEKIKDDPRVLLSASGNAFGTSMQLAVRHELLLLEPADGTFDTTASTIAASMLVLLHRQLYAYLEGPLSAPSEELLIKTAAAPLHNIAGERILGMFDAQARRAPNATVGFVDGKIKAKLNKSLDYLLSKHSLQQQNFLPFLVSRAATIKQELCSITADLEVEGRKRQVVMGQKRDQAARKKMQKDINAHLTLREHVNLLEMVDECLQDFVQSLLSERVPQDSFVHVWDVDGSDTIFHGSVIGFKIVKRVLNVNVQYVNDICSLPLSEFICDIATEDVYLQN